MSEPVRWGYDTSDVAAIAGRMVSLHATRYRYDEWTEAKAVAADAIVELLLTAPERPSGRDLARAAGLALDREQRSDLRWRGVDEHTARTTRAKTQRGNLIRGYVYLANSHRLESPFEDAIVERIALAQVMAALRPFHRDVLKALAAGSNPDFHHVSVARRAFRELWLYPDPPGRHWHRTIPRRTA